MMVSLVCTELVHRDSSENLTSPVGNGRVEASVQKVSKGCELTRMLQMATYKYIARPVVRGRWVFLAIYLILLVVSAALTSQLNLATKPPQLFQSDSNLQMLLDLSANFTDQNIKCDRCSGVYVTGTETLNQTKKETPRTVDPVVPGPLPPDILPSETPLPSSTRPSLPSPQPAPTRAPKTPAPTPIPTPPPKPDNSPSPSTTAPDTETDAMTTPTPQASLSTSQAPVLVPSPATTTPPDMSQTSPTTPPPITSVVPEAPSSTPTPKQPASTKPVVTEPPSTTLSTPAPTDPPTLGLCNNNRCDDVEERPNLQDTASVFVVFGIQALRRGNQSASLFSDSEDDSLVYDDKFSDAFSMESLLEDTSPLAELCRVCKLIANNTDFVQPNGAQCLPEYIFLGDRDTFTLNVGEFLKSVPECQDIPVNQKYLGRYLPTRAMVGYTLPGFSPDATPGFKWIAFTFASTTFQGQSYFSAYRDYQKWESFIQHIRDDILTSNSSLHSIYQASEFWTKVLMEVVAVNSAIYGLVFSMLICISIVAIFTGHFILLLIIVLTIFGVVLFVVAIFYMAGWELGAVEAVSLSILVGSSVDYCAHVVEGYLQAGDSVPVTIQGNAHEARRWRTRSAVSHIGVSIISSAITTVASSIPLTQTVIMPFSKFGQIVAINTTVSIVYTLTACTAFLGLFAPAFYKRTWRSITIAFAVTATVITVLVLALFTMARFGYHIPGPNGEDLFPVPT